MFKLIKFRHIIYSTTTQKYRIDKQSLSQAPPHLLCWHARTQAKALEFVTLKQWQSCVRVE